MNNHLKLVAIVAAFFSLGTISHASANHWGTKQQTFTVADLQKMVDELKPYLPEDPRLTYPIKCVVVEKDEVNANASFEEEAGAAKDAKPRAKMTVYTGLLKFMKDIRLVRAVVAHELSHLAKQHLGKGMKVHDLGLILTRQQEYEADVTGAIALEKAGYKKDDMVDMLFKLGESSKDWPGSEKVLGDHADTARRASNVGGNNLVLRSMVSFITGEAYADARNYLPAMQAFDKAAGEEPKFYESKYNAAQAALMNYYFNLAPNLVTDWYVPDFGPSLEMPTWKGKSAAITDGDRKNYELALAHIKIAVDADPSRRESLELQGLGLVLDPDGKADSLQSGIKSLKSALEKAMVDTDKLRIANNLAVGYQRSGNVTEAMKFMLDTQRSTNSYNSFLAVNLGQQVPGDEFKSDALKAEAVIYTYLTRTPSNALGYTKAVATYHSLCTKFGLKEREVKEAPVYLCTVLTLTEKGKTVKILDSLDDVLAAFGKPMNATRYSETYQGMKEFIWDSGNFSIITDSRMAGDTEISEVLRITSYSTGSYFDIVAREKTVNATFRVTVGMSVSDFAKFLDPKSGIARNLVKAGAIEEWTYFPGLNMGILIKNDKIVGITVAPVVTPEPASNLV